MLSPKRDICIDPLKVQGTLKERMERKDKLEDGEGMLGDAVFWSRCGCCMHELAGTVVTKHAQGDKLSQHSGSTSWTQAAPAGLNGC